MPKKGKIVLIPFPFTDLSAPKVRPAVIISSFLQGEDIIVAFISSVKNRIQKTDIILNSQDKNFSKTGLKADSVIKTGKLATLDKKIILGEIGEISADTGKEINKKIKILFGL